MEPLLCLRTSPISTPSPLRDGRLAPLERERQVVEEAVSYTDGFKAEGFSFYGGHCTGDNAVKQFRAKFGDAAVRPMGSGRTMDY
jgi:metal-dependent hydrolase (beta-lactamase superfamily II)